MHIVNFSFWSCLFEASLNKRSRFIPVQLSFLDLAHWSLFARPIIIKTTPHPRKLTKARLIAEVKTTPSPMKQTPRAKKTLISISVFVYSTSSTFQPNLNQSRFKPYRTLLVSNQQRNVTQTLSGWLIPKCFEGEAHTCIHWSIELSMARFSSDWWCRRFFLGYLKKRRMAFLSAGLFWLRRQMMLCKPKNNQFPIWPRHRHTFEKRLWLVHMRLYLLM